MTIIVASHPREPETFHYTQTEVGPNGFRRVIRSYVAFDSRWPWWKRAIAHVINATKEPTNG